jgi:hypothetical protein
MEKKHMDVMLAKAIALDSHGKPQNGAKLDVPGGSSPVTPPPTAPAIVAPTGNGKLSVGAQGGWCNVTVDGVPRGATPVAGLEMTSGPHKVTCTPDGGKAQSAVVNVPIDGTARFKFTL